jgi:ribosome-binding protein aMBF1 (putative translation factor)
MPDGFFKDWLNSVVTITAPTNVEAALREFEDKKVRAGKKVSSQRKSKKLQNPNKTHTHLAETELTGEVLKQVRLSKGWTQADLASLIGKSVSWVKLAEGGLRRIKEDDQVRLQKIFNMQ